MNIVFHTSEDSSDIRFYLLSMRALAKVLCMATYRTQVQAMMSSKVYYGFYVLYQTICIMHVGLYGHVPTCCGWKDLFELRILFSGYTQLCLKTSCLLTFLYSHWCTQCKYDNIK